MTVLECKGGIPFSSVFRQKRAIASAKRYEKEVLARQPEIKVPHVGGTTIADMARDEVALIESGRTEQCGRPKLMPSKKTSAEKRAEKFSECRARLMSLIDMRGPDECWPWMGTTVQSHPKYPSSTYPRAYGFDPLHAAKPRRTYPYRLAYLLQRGQIPAGMTVDHICFNPLCCNPAHMQLLTRAENSARKNPARKKKTAPGLTLPGANDETCLER